MTTPDELLAFAAGLCADSRESARRAAVSRAYYAAFWHLRTAVEERFGTLDVEGPDVHRELFRVVQLWDPDVARNLMTLRLDRNRADYEPRSAVSVVAASRGVSAAFAILRA